MLCALTVRRLKPGAFDEFAEAFGPPEGVPPRGWLKFNMVRSTSDPEQVVTFGLFDGTLEQLEASQRDIGFEERRASIAHLVEEVEVNGVFEVVKEMTPAADPVGAEG